MTGKRHCAGLAITVAMALALASAGPAQGAESCSRAKAVELKPFLLNQAYSINPRYFGDITDDMFLLEQVACADLTGDADPEMIVSFACCTGGSIQPWGIWRHDAHGRWVLGFTSATDNLRRRLVILKRGVRATSTVRYEGACTRRVHNHLAQWDGQRFRGRTGRAYDLPKPYKFCA